MIIDKTIGGEWLVDHRSTELDNAAYYIYIKDRIKNNYPVKPDSQYLFKVFKRISYSKYYDDVILILRKEKIDKILSRGNNIPK